MLTNIFKSLSIKDYKNNLSIRDTLIAINFINVQIKSFYLEKYKIYHIQNGPICFLNDLCLNDINNYNENEKTLMVNSSNMLIDLSYGVCKYSRVMATNLNLGRNEALFVESKVFNINKELSENKGICEDRLVISIPSNKSNFNDKIFENYKNIFEEGLCKTINLVKKKYKLSGIVKKKNFKYIQFNNFGFSNVKSLLNSLTKVASTVDDIIVISNVSMLGNSQKKLFKNDIFDWNYYSQYYVFNKYTNEIALLAEIGKTIMYKNNSKQFKNVDQLTIDLYLKKLIQNKLKNFFQISINKNILYLYSLNKYHLSECSTSTWSNNDYIKFETNNILSLS